MCDSENPRQDRWIQYFCASQSKYTFQCTQFLVPIISSRELFHVLPLINFEKVQKYSLSSIVKMVGPRARSAFEEALEEYIESLPEKNSARKMFLASIERTGGEPMTPESISAVVEDAEKKVSQKITTRAFRRLVRPIITVLKEYYCIVDTLCQANQMPGSVIWGSLKIIVDVRLRSFIFTYIELKHRFRHRFSSRLMTFTFIRLLKPRIHTCQIHN